MNETPAHATALDVPMGRVYYADYIKTDYGIIFESVDALLLGIMADPKMITGNAIDILRFERDINGIWVVYDACVDYACDCTAQRVSAQIDRVNRNIDLQGVYLTALDGEQHLNGRTEKMEPLTDEQWENIERVDADCEQFELIAFEYIHVGIAVK